MMDFHGKTVWITGASSGIGEALAYDLSRRGARLILSSRTASDLQAVREHCARPDEHLVRTLDLADPASIQSAADDVLDTVHAVDVLVNNGGVTQRGTARETSMDAVRRIMEVNFFGTVQLTKAVLPSMLARQNGHIAVVSSVVGKIGTPLRSTYAASKHALHGWFDSLRAEVHDEGLRVTLVCPGYVNTNILSHAVLADGTSMTEAGETPPDEPGIPPEDCARTIAEAIENEKGEVYVGGWEIAGIYVHRLSPALYQRLIRAVSS